MGVSSASPPAKPFPRVVFLALALVSIFSAAVFDVRSDDGFPSHLAGVDVDSVDWKAKDTVYWRDALSKKRFRICRRGGTEFPYTGKYNSFYKNGVYKCSSCGLELFSSEDKYDSHTGWPSFTRSIKKGAVAYKSDGSFGMSRTEILCGRCGAHLGHIFDDGPPPAGKRYCVNSVCLFHERPGKGV